MFFDNPAIGFGFLAAMLVGFVISRKLGLGYAFRIASLTVAFLLWYGAAGGVPGMFADVKAAAQTVADWGRGLGQEAAKTDIGGGNTEGGGSAGEQGAETEETPATGEE